MWTSLRIVQQFVFFKFSLIHVQQKCNVFSQVMENPNKLKSKSLKSLNLIYLALMIYPLIYLINR